VIRARRRRPLLDHARVSQHLTAKTTNCDTGHFVPDRLSLQSDAGPNTSSQPVAFGSKTMTMTLENPSVTRGHKGLGIASFVIGVICLITVMGLVVVAGVVTNAGRATPEFNMILGLGMISVVFVDLIGIVLGIFGAANRSSKKVYPVLGLVLNVLVVALFSALLIIGLSMRPA
jgi:hypothetical protein